MFLFDHFIQSLLVEYLPGSQNWQVGQFDCMEEEEGVTRSMEVMQIPVIIIRFKSSRDDVHPYGLSYAFKKESIHPDISSYMISLVQIG